MSVRRGSLVSRVPLNQRKTRSTSRRGTRRGGRYPSYSLLLCTTDERSPGNSSRFRAPCSSNLAGSFRRLRFTLCEDTANTSKRKLQQTWESAGVRHHTRRATTVDTVGRCRRDSSQSSSKTLDRWPKASERRMNRSKARLRGPRRSTAAHMHRKEISEKRKGAISSYLYSCACLLGSGLARFVHGDACRRE